VFTHSDSAPQGELSSHSFTSAGDDQLVNLDRHVIAAVCELSEALSITNVSNRPTILSILGFDFH